MKNKNKYIATATRKNIDGKPDYCWIFKHSNGLPVLFDSPEKALNCAIAKCADSSHSLYNPKFEMV